MAGVLEDSLSYGCCFKDRTSFDGPWDGVSSVVSARDGEGCWFDDNGFEHDSGKDRVFNPFVALHELLSVVDMTVIFRYIFIISVIIE